MADMGSLEKMGRELKCPICLSLLRSAASVSCNHIFCHDCLTKSMKSTSSCPVCKVPFRRREIRPAPHMDNLVSIFKSMEAATGTNVVSTQVTSAVEVADVSKRGSSRKKCKGSEKPVTGRKKMPSTTEDNIKKPTASCPTTKASFSMNKRIHVTPFPESETPVRPKKIMKPEVTKNKLNDDVAEGKDRTLDSDKLGGFSLSPFFCLKEGEDEENDTAETLSEPLSLETPLRHNAPTFSDIKDSDDEAPPNMTPNSKVEVPEVFDSEIFEWTQRPCSPELCSSPVKIQGKHKYVLDQIAEKDDEEDVHLDLSDELGHPSNAPQPVSAKNSKQNGKKARARKSRTTKLTSNQNLSIKEANPNQQDSNSTKSLAAKSCERNGNTTERNTSSRRNKTLGNINLVPCSNIKSSKTVLPKEGDLEIQAHDDQPSERLQKKGKHSQRKKCVRKLEVAGYSTVEATESNCEPKIKRVRQMSDGVNSAKTTVVAALEKETRMQQLHSCIEDSTQHKHLDGGSKKSKFSEDMNSNSGVNNIKPNVDRNKSNIISRRHHSNEATPAVPPIKNVSVKNNLAKATEQSDCSRIKQFGKLHCTARSTSSKKCGDTVSKVSCVFCQFDGITEESGEMVHYHNGKEVSAEFGGGANVIHSHKNCLEWAPNVYFEDESVFNLMSELARSRRIKCACCGIKGATLGCFDMSCRKSFHFTCAKLIPECRWDNENFVMLCPLHESSKLPNESSSQQKGRERRIIPKGLSQVRSSQDCSNSWKWTSGSPQKWVLCCSALTAAEKELVSEFVKVAGVSISTTWNPSVTHVISSTDSSGACKRTLKFLMAILNGKWIVSIDWVKTCMDCMEPVDEQKFEIITDVHGISEGPRLGRQRIINKQPKLFNGMRFYLHGDYTKSYRGYLQDLLVAAGGSVLQRKPVSRDHQKLLDDSSTVLIVCSAENQKAKTKDATNADDRRGQADAHALACASGGKVVSSAWIIDSIAASSLQSL